MIFRLVKRVLMNPVVAFKTHRPAEKIQAVHFKFFYPLLTVPASAGRDLDFYFHIMAEQEGVEPISSA